MDDSTFDQLEAALSAAPGNVALLTVLLGACLERGEHARGLKLLPPGFEQLADAQALKSAAARLLLADGQAERALPLIEGQDPAARLLRARPPAAMGHLQEAQA
ncbi:MAG: ATP-binding protein, partial [Pseudomonas sp.]